jgi:hypothetical protein
MILSYVSSNVLCSSSLARKARTLKVVLTPGETGHIPGSCFIDLLHEPSDSQPWTADLELPIETGDPL